MANNLTLAPNFSIPAVDYAGQGNAILGIRDAGKTYTAMKAAEELLENKIPIIVYDPVGIWKNLKIGTGKHKGFPVVVAGGEGSDIRLSTSNASDIVRAAMKENVSLVIDLYSPELINKSTWIRIVQETVDLLMYENKPCGLRHIFIEEAAEFIPQRLQPQHAKVYASLERLARMGRNARLGYTLINQRAEEVNKAILEISAFSLLHKQVGKNSLKSIQQWMELLQVENAKEIVHSLPTLKQGECWVIGMNTKPHRIKVAQRKTFHPDPKGDAKDQLATTVKLDVSSFVEKLNKQLEKPNAPSGKDTLKGKAAETRQAIADNRQVELLQTKIQDLQQKNEIWRKQFNSLQAAFSQSEDERRRLLKFHVKQITDIKAVLNREYESTEVKSLSDSLKDIQAPTSPIHNLPTKVVHNSEPKVVTSAATGKLGKCSAAILNFLATFPERNWSKTQVGVAIGYSPTSSGFHNSLSELNTKGLILRDAGRLRLSPSADVSEWIGAVTSQNYDIHTFRNKLGKCEGEIYEVLLSHPKQQFTKEDLAAATASNYSPTSSGFHNSLSALSTLELLKRDRGLIQLNPELLEL
jgi:hypothetical protein